MTTAALVAAASYDSALKVPACIPAAGGCDTGLLVNGRGPVGPEANAPNTLGGSCADGTSGVYHSDESIDRIRIYTTDGSLLAPGKQVTVEVTVWAYSNYQGDFLDLYYSNSADFPYWSHVATLQPTGAGAQTLSTTFTLYGSTSPTQLVRAAFRYMGSAGTCTTGSYDERDDVAFAVAAPAAPAASNHPRLVAGGSDFTLAVRADGKVSAWGYNSHGQLGKGYPLAGIYSTPVEVLGLTSVKAVAAGLLHSLALREDGTVWAWGYNYYGQLGDGTQDLKGTPVQVPGLTGIISIAAGAHHSLALRNDGLLFAWGNNDYGQLGDGTTTPRYSPVMVPRFGLWGPEFVLAIDAGDYYSMALTSEHAVWAWGYNSSGQLGDSTTTSRSSPTMVHVISGMDMHAISAGAHHALALRSDGALYAWGAGAAGQLGNNTFTAAQTTPVSVPLSGAVELATGSYHSLARTSDGSVWTWGSNSQGQLGIDPATPNRSTPGTIAAPVSKALAGGSNHSMLYTATTNQVYTWGDNATGQLGTGDLVDRSAPTYVPLP